MKKEEIEAFNAGLKRMAVASGFTVAEFGDGVKRLNRAIDAAFFFPAHMLHEQSQVNNIKVSFMIKTGRGREAADRHFDRLRRLSVVLPLSPKGLHNVWRHRMDIGARPIPSLRNVALDLIRLGLI